MNPKRILIGTALAALALGGGGAASMIGRPAASTAAAPGAVQLVQPAADATVTTEPAAPLVDQTGIADRAEAAAGRAEGAATRAEGAATRAEIAVAAVTTTTTTGTAVSPAPPTTPLPTDGSTLAPVVVDPIPGTTTTSSTTTTTTLPPKRWVTVVTFHPSVNYYNTVTPPIQFSVDLESGVLRVTGVDPLPNIGMPGAAAVWVGVDSEPTGPCPASADNHENVIAISRPPADCPVWAGPVPTGPQTISIGQRWWNSRDSAAVWRAPYNVSGDIIVEEYR